MNIHLALEIVQEARNQFRKYEVHHREKGADEKADANRLATVVLRAAPPKKGRAS